MTGVGVRKQHRVRQVLAQHIGILDRDHDVKDAAYDEAWLGYFAQLGESLACEGFPGSKGGHLSFCNLWARNGVPILLTLRESCNESLTCRLARPAGCEEKFHQPLRSREIGIEDFFQVRTVHVHDVLAAFWAGADEHHLAYKRRSRERDLLRDHATQRETKQIHACEAERVEEGKRMRRHSLDRLRHLAD